MNKIDTVVSGQRSNWTLMKKLGEGDAGEVYLVASLVGNRVGVLKRPQRNAFGGEIMRQATQIKNEGILLKALAGGHNIATRRLRIPELLDQSLPGTEFTDRMFIVIEKALGFDLGFLMRTSAMGLPQDVSPLDIPSPAELSFLMSIADTGEIPSRILLSCLLDLANLLEWIHSRPVDLEGMRAAGIIYNDIKPEHIFWDPGLGEVMLIDWGNGQLIERDGMSRDRRFSSYNDNLQYLEEMGKFLETTSPGLRQRLAWPAVFEMEEGNLFRGGGIRERIQEVLNEEDSLLKEVQEREQKCLVLANANQENLILLTEIQHEIQSLGAAPDYSGALRFASGYATQLVIAGQVEGLEPVCAWASKLPGANQEQWKLVLRLAQISKRSQDEILTHFLEALQAAVCLDGQQVLWQLLCAIQDAPAPDWWYEVVGAVRRMQLGVDAEALLPLISVNRLGLRLQAHLRKLEDGHSPQPSQGGAGGAVSLPADFIRLQGFLRNLQQYEMATWSMIDPPPPHALLSYGSLFQLLDELGTDFPQERQTTERALSQPQARVQQVLDAWERKDFMDASLRLRHLLMWDPDRRRVLRADQLIHQSLNWLTRVHMGPLEGENFSDFVTNLEFEGREFRNHIGPASWLDTILDSFSRLRKGVWPADLLAAAPYLNREMPWLKGFERLERLPEEIKNLSIQDGYLGELAPEGGGGGPPTDTLVGTVSLQTPVQLSGLNRIKGSHQGRFGPEGDLYLIEPLDAWVPEARGSSARVYLGDCADGKGKRQRLAVKLMRMDKVEYALPLFREEVRILSVMDTVPGICRMIECGFISLKRDGPLPDDSNLKEIQSLSGDLLRIGLTDWEQFDDQLESYVADGWTPYLVIEKREKEESLFYLCDAGLNHGRYQPLIHLLQISVQICDILQAAHERNIVYRDHKILHYYWHKQTHGVYFIDWNVARLHPDRLTETEIQMDLVQYGARGLHYILTGRSAPGALPLGPTRPEEIEQSAQSYKPQWNYDDQRLPLELREIVENVLTGGYSSAISLRDDLKKSYMQLPYASA